MSARAEAPGVAMFIPTLTGGGAERVLVNLLKMLPDRPRHLVLMERKIAYEYDATLHVLAGEFAAGGGPPLRRLRRLGENLVGVALLKRRLPVAWISFTTWANVLNVLSRGRGRVILTSHSRESAVIAGRSAPLVRRLVRLTYPRADAIVAVSSAVKRDLVDNLGVPEERVFTIYNTVDAEEIERLAREPLEPELASVMSGRCAVTAGTLRPEKGQWHLLRAFAALKRHDTAAKLVIMGDGPLHGYLTRLARDLGLSTHVHGEAGSAALPSADVAFLGFRSNPFAVLSRATVFAFPSLSEGFGNVIIEALACGAPVISADCPSGPREILSPERAEAESATAPEYASAGVLMPTFDGERRAASAPLTPAENIWAETLAGALHENDLKGRYEAAGRARARAFTLEAIGPEWRRLLDPS